MLNLAVTLLIIALIAAVLGFGGIAMASVELAKIVFFCCDLAVPNRDNLWRPGRPAARALAGPFTSRNTPGRVALRAGRPSLYLDRACARREAGVMAAPRSRNREE
jgi:uncharacterized membrane protein YtjA (UPF0391 family)